MPSDKRPPRSQTSLPPSQTRQGDGLLFSKGLNSKRFPGSIFEKMKQDGVLGASYNFFSSSILVSTASRVIVGASSVRAYLLLQNLGTADIYLGFGTRPSITTPHGGPKLVADAVYSFTDLIVPRNTIEAISGTADQEIIIVEGVPSQ